MRKTVPVEALRVAANRCILSDISDEARDIVFELVRGVLYENKTYNGFTFHDWGHGGFERWTKAGCPVQKKEFLGNQHKKVFLP